MSATHPEAPDVVVVGGGVLGLAVAWRARARGLQRARPRARRARRRRLARRRRHARARHRGRRAASATCSSSGCRARAAGRPSPPSCTTSPAIDVGYRATGTLVVARDRDEAEALDRELALRERLGLTTDRLLPSRGPPPRARAGARPSASRSTCPTTTPSTRARSSRALAPPSPRPASRLRGRRRRAACSPTARASTGVRSTAASGAAPARSSSRPAPGPARSRPADGARVPVRPVKGQILRLRDPAGPGLRRRRVLRCEGGYLVPRGDGRYVLGATVEERGFDTVGHRAAPSTSCCATRPSSCRACSSSRSTSSWPACAPGRPTTRPCSAPSALDGLFWATGHHRNGDPARAGDRRPRRRASSPASRRHAFGPAVLAGPLRRGGAR